MRLSTLVVSLLTVAFVTPMPQAVAAEGDLASPETKDIAMQLVSSAENSSLKWKRQYKYIEDIGDGRGYTAGIIGFCSGTGDMLQVVKAYKRNAPGNRLEKYIPALRKVNGTDSHEGLGRPFIRAWRKSSKDPIFREAQNRERDRTYFDPAVRLAKTDGLGALGQFAYYDAAVVHGYRGLKGIRKRALEKASPPSEGETEEFWLDKFLDERLREMKKEAAHAGQLDRITKTQRKFLDKGNLALEPPLKWTVNQTKFRIDE